MYYAIHKIVYGENQTAEPGTLFEPTEVDVDFLLSMNAIREPTEAETALYERLNPTSAPAPARPAKGAKTLPLADTSTGRNGADTSDVL